MIAYERGSHNDVLLYSKMVNNFKSPLRERNTFVERERAKVALGIGPSNYAVKPFHTFPPATYII